MKKYTYLIIGSSAAGISAINKLFRIDPEATIACISDEKEQPYNKCFLADYLSGEKSESQVFTKLFHPRVEWLLNKKVLAIDPDLRQAVLSDNARVCYDKLLIATGSSPFMPPIGGIDGPGVFFFHSLADTNWILSTISKGDFSRVTIIGAGLSGLEAADALRSQNLSVTIVERAEQVLPGHVDREASEYLVQKMKDNGISFMPNQTVTKINYKDDHKIQSVLLDDGTSLSSDMVICATGLKPNSELGVAAGLATDDDSLLVNQYQQTSNEHIYAAGDVVKVSNQLTGKMVRSTTWPDAMHQGLIAAQAMAGAPKTYPGIIPTLSSSFFGVKFSSCGITDFHKREGFTTVSCKGSPDEYCKMFLKDGIPAGFVMIGQTLPQLAAMRRSVLMRQPYVKPTYKHTYL